MTEYERNELVRFIESITFDTNKDRNLSWIKHAIDMIKEVIISKIDDIYNEANYNYANELYAQKKPYEALRYYRNIPDYKDVTEKKLNRICYRILGSWVSAKGIKMEFRDDGTCTIDGKDGYFNVSMYAMSVGTRANDLNQNWQIYSCTDKSLSVINNSNKTQYKLTRVTEE